MIVNNVEATKDRLVTTPTNCWVIFNLESVTVNKVEPQMCGTLPKLATMIIKMTVPDLKWKKKKSYEQPKLVKYLHHSKGQ